MRSRPAQSRRLRRSRPMWSAKYPFSTCGSHGTIIDSHWDKAEGTRLSALVLPRVNWAPTATCAASRPIPCRASGVGAWLRENRTPGTGCGQASAKAEATNSHLEGPQARASPANPCCGPFSRSVPTKGSDTVPLRSVARCLPVASLSPRLPVNPGLADDRSVSTDLGLTAFSGERPLRIPQRTTRTGRKLKKIFRALGTEASDRR